MRALILAVVLAVGLAGCAGTQVKTPDQGVLACYASVNAMAGTAVDLKNRGKLTKEQQQQAFDIGNQALAACDAARAALGQGDMSTAEGKLKIANSILLQVEAMLAAQGVK
jgi:uncharacterized membrane protein